MAPPGSNKRMALGKIYARILSSRYVRAAIVFRVTKNENNGRFAHWIACSCLEYQFIPSVRTAYYMTRDLLFEVEVGGKLSLADASTGREYQNELLIVAGVRYDFATGR